MAENSSGTTYVERRVTHDASSNHHDMTRSRAEPLISVCMPVFNAERYLAKAVESILAQTCGDFEFLVIDDGSTDKSLAMLRHYANRDARIRLSSRSNAGYLVRLNEMLDEARGQFIARMDADDIAMPERFAKQLEFLAAHPEVVAVGSRVLAIDSEDDPITEFCTHQTHEEIDQAHIEIRGGHINHPAAMIRTSVMRSVGGYRAKYWPAEDVDLWLRLAEIGRLANVPETLLKYRQHLESTGYTKQVSQYSGLRAAAIDACERRGIPLPADSLHIATPVERSLLDHQLTWAWWALLSGHRRTAWKYAFRLLRISPRSSQVWRFVACSLRGY